jgi:hypothetical protein
MNILLEISVIEKFFKKEKQDRYINFISSSKNREKFIQQLCHLKDLKWELFQEVSSFNISDIEKQYSSQLCYVISEEPSVDGTNIALEKVPALTNNGYAMIIVFGDADKIYYEGEPPYNRYLSK